MELVYSHPQFHLLSKFRWMNVFRYIFIYKDWEDLWRPELTGRIAMVDSPREVVGAVLKSLGASYNARDFDNEVDGGREAVKQRFIAFRKQVYGVSIYASLAFLYGSQF